MRLYASARQIAVKSSIGLAAACVVAALVGVAIPFLPPLGVIAAVALVVLLVLFMTRLELVLMLLLLLRSSVDAAAGFSMSLRQGFNLSLATGLGTMLILAGSAYLLANRVSLRATIMPPVLMFLGAALLSALSSQDLLLSVADFSRFLSCLILYFLIIHLVTTGTSPAKLLWCIFASAIVPLLVGFYQYLMGTGYRESILYYGSTIYSGEALNRLQSTFVHPNSYAYYLVILFLACLPLAMAATVKARKTALWLLSLAMGCSLIFTYTRGAWFSVLVGLFILGILWSRKLLVLPVILILAVVVILPSAAIYATRNVFDPNPAVSSMATRLLLWRSFIPVLKDHWLLGAGFGTFTIASSRISGTALAAHNEYLRMWVETGGLGLVAYLWLFGRMLLDAFNVYRRTSNVQLRALATGVIAAIAAFLIACTVDNVAIFPVIQWYVWGLAALVQGAWALESRQAALHPLGFE